MARIEREFAGRAKTKRSAGARINDPIKWACTSWQSLTAFYE
jgi:hypothetical protein